MSSVCCVSALLSLLLGWWLKKRNFELQPELYKNCHQCTNSIFSHLFVECMVLSFYLQFLWEGAIFSGWCVVENVLERRLLAQNQSSLQFHYNRNQKKTIRSGQMSSIRLKSTLILLILVFTVITIASCGVVLSEKLRCSDCGSLPRKQIEPCFSQCDACFKHCDKKFYHRLTDSVQNTLWNKCLQSCWIQQHSEMSQPE